MSRFVGLKGEPQAALALAAGATVQDAATSAGVTDRTLFRRLQDPDYRCHVFAVRGALMDRALGQLADAAVEAVTTLRDLLTANSDAVRLGAARAILEHGVRLRDLVELEQRLAALEERW